MTAEQEQAAALIGLKLASAVSLAMCNGLELGVPMIAMKANLKTMFNDLVDETVADMIAAGIRGSGRG